jgi:tetratricopeptide (TPR) repeat protein
MSAPTNKRRALDVQRWRVPGLCLVLAAITFAVFGQTLHYEFINYDDDDYVYENPVVSGGITIKGIVWAFTRAHFANWHPLTWLSHELDCQLYGLNPGGHHLTSVLLHIATVIALFLVLRQMTGALWRSAFVAAVFAIHPLRVESVAWVAERKDVLSGLFFMLTLGAYVRYARHPWSLARYGLVVLLFAMGLMCKPMLVTLPVVLMLLDYWPLRRVEPRKLSRLAMEKLPLLALSGIFCVVTFLAQHEAIQSTDSISLSLRFANALVTCMVYLGQMVYPAGLAVLYPYPHNGLLEWEVMLAVILLAGVSAVALWKRRTQPWMLTGWLWYLVMLLPVAGIVQVGFQAHADRYTYLPQIGICLALTWWAAELGLKWMAPRAAIGVVMTVVIGALMVCARIQTAYWKNNETLWTHAIDCTKNNASAHLSLGTDLLAKGKVDEAIAEYQKSLQIRPTFAYAHLDLGNAFFKKGKMDEAAIQFQQALQINPAFTEARNNLGNVLFHMGRRDEAIAQFQQALQITPDDAATHNNFGDALRQEGKLDEAISHFEQALQARPDFAEAHYNFGIALRQKGKLDEAIAQYRRALEIKVDYEEACNNLGNALLQKGSVDEAVTQYQKALQINPNYADAHNNLGHVLLQKGKLDEAITELQHALQIKPRYADAHYYLGAAYLQKGRVDDAINEYQKAVQIKPDYAEAQSNLGNILAQLGRVDEAMAHLQKALQIEPDSPTIQNSMAWLLATCAEASLRNGPKAVELAQQANAASDGENPMILHTLAAAFAEAGRFSEAVETARRALRLAEAQSNVRLAGQLQTQLQRYESGLPLRQ